MAVDRDIGMKSYQFITFIYKSHQYTSFNILSSFNCYPRDANASTVFAVIACLTVRPSFTRQYCIKMAKCRISKTTQLNSPGTL